MQNTTTNSLAWAGARKAVAVVRLSPATQWMLPSVWAVFSKIISLSVFHAILHQKFTRSCTPSRRFFTDAFGLNKSTISSITGSLVKTGHLSKIQRRPVLGMWQTCLYRIEGFLLKRIKDVIYEFIKILNRVASSRHIVSRELQYKDIQRENKVSNPLSLPPPCPDWLVRQSERMGLTAINA